MSSSRFFRTWIGLMLFGVPVLVAQVRYPSPINTPTPSNTQLMAKMSQGGSEQVDVVESKLYPSADVSPEATPGSGTSAQDKDIVPQPAVSKVAAPAKVGLGNLTYHGITVYGNIDVGAQHQTHGATYNSNAPQTGLQQIINKNGNHATTHYSQNGISQSIIGIKGDEKLFRGVSVIFKLEPGIEPLDCLSGVACFTNSIQSLVTNNGVALQNQSANFDTNRGGRIDNGDVYFGLAAKGEGHSSGSLVFGRVVSIMSDNVSRYDPNAGSYAFSLISYVGQVSGGGDAEDLRLDSTLKFTSQLGPFRVGALTQLSGNNAAFQPDGVYGSNKQLDIGADFRRLSVDVIYSTVRDAISAASLTAAQMKTLPVNSLSATISDNTAFAVMGKYNLGRTKLYAGYDHIRYKNPNNPLTAGITTIGGYKLSVLTQNAYTYNKILTAYWAGARYSLTPRLDLSGGFYTFGQNSYSGTGCSDNSNSKCSGSLYVSSVATDYKLTKFLDVYLGAEGSHVTNGYSSGYLYTSDVTTTIGGRFRF